MTKYKILAAVLTLIIALMGGVPGGIAIWQYIFRVEAALLRQPQQMIFCFINSDLPALSGKPAVLLTRLAVVGKGRELFFVRDFDVEIRCGGQWLQGRLFVPRIRNITDRNGETMPAVTIVRYPKYKAEIDTLYVGGWIRFSPSDTSDKGLRYGESQWFSVAAYFDALPDSCTFCDRLRVDVIDYLDNRSTTVFDTTTGLANLGQPLEDIRRWRLIH